MPRREKGEPFESASSEAALEFVRKLQAEFEHVEGDDAAMVMKLEARLKELETLIGKKEMQKIGRRIMMDILKRPERTVTTDTGRGRP